MRQGAGWLDAMVGLLRCASCGEPYGRQDLRVAGERQGYVFVRCECRACRKEGIAVVLTELAGGRRSRPALTEDDVLAAHDLLREFSGRVDALFGPGPITTR